MEHGNGNVLLTLYFTTEFPLFFFFQSDMYSLGVILLELFQPFGTEMERAEVLTGLRTGQLPESLSKRCPVQAKYIQHLTRRNSSQRPSAVQLLQSELFQTSGNVCAFVFLGPGVKVVFISSLGEGRGGWCPWRLGLEEADDGSGGGAYLFSSTSCHSSAGCARRTHSP